MSLPYLKSVAAQPAETYIERTIANLRNALREHPEDELYLKHQILLLSQTEEKEDVVIALAFELMALDLEKIYAADCFLILARSYVQKKDTKEAVIYYRKAIAADPELDPAITELAELYENQFDYDAAIATYNYLNTIYDLKEYMYSSQGLCYFKKKEYEKALECFQTSLKLNPDDKDEECIHNIGACYINMKNYTEAFSLFGKWLEKNPNSAEAHYGMGLCYEHTGDGYRALHHYFEAVKIKPGYTDAYNNIAAVIINQEGDYKAGVEMLKKAIETSPDKDNKSLTLVYLNLTHIYKRLREFTLADYYKAEYMKSLGFDISFEEDDDDDL